MAESARRLPPAAAAALRALPPVEGLARRLVAAHPGAVDHRVAVAVARRTIDAERTRLLEGRIDGVDPELVVAAAAAALDGLLADRLRPVINASGILLHTGLGRATVAPVAAEAMARAAAEPVAVELDLDTGRRGRRTAHVAELAATLTGAEAATVVNNGAAALLLALAALAGGRRVVVSRGELVEIGGAFRLPDVIEAGGATLAEVGTTNRTRAADYERAVAVEPAAAGAILKVHASNYRIEGFTAEASIEDLAAVARRWDVPLVHDIGSGRLSPHDAAADLAPEEPDAATSLASGADLVLFSGDKLLGGPQAGLLVGRRDLIARLDRHPMHRAMRVDAVTLAGLAATLRLHLDPARAIRDLPALAAAAAPLAALERRGAAIVAALGGVPGLAAEVVDGTAYLGGGTTPARARPSRTVRLRFAHASDAALAARLRAGDPGVVARTADGAVHLDLRSVPPDRDGDLAAAVRVAATVTGRPA